MERITNKQLENQLDTDRLTKRELYYVMQGIINTLEHMQRQEVAA